MSVMTSGAFLSTFGSSFLGPPTARTNAICLPSGDQRKSWQLSSVCGSCRGSPPASGATMICEPLPALFRYANDCPEGLHCGACTLPDDAKARGGWLASSGATQMELTNLSSAVSGRLTTYATHLLSGDT